MREILFRGKTAGEEWIEGFPMVFTENYVQICRPMEHSRTVYPETVGQYVGRTDKKGKMIFEGDILSHFINYLGKRINGVVKYDEALTSYMWQQKEGTSLFLCDVLDKNGAEIIGNIHDNPELLT